MLGLLRFSRNGLAGVEWAIQQIAGHSRAYSLITHCHGPHNHFVQCNLIPSRWFRAEDHRLKAPIVPNALFADFDERRLHPTSSTREVGH
jgi:hypothetical protein